MKTYSLSYAMKDWKETPILERPDGYKVTQVQARFTYEGPLAGEAQVVYQLFYKPDGTGYFEGWETFTGTLEGIPGGIILNHRGSFDPKGVDDLVRSQPQSGQGSLAAHQMQYAVRYAGHGPYALEVSLTQE